MKRPRVVSGWRHSWRWVSVQANVAAQFVLGAWVFMRDQALPRWATLVVWILLGIALIGRYFKQKGDE